MRVSIVGGGPRGLSALERLVSTAAASANTATTAATAGTGTNAAARGASESPRPVEITVFEPFELGSGRVWRRDQSRNYLMNTPSSFPTAVPSKLTLASAPAAEAAPCPADGDTRPASAADTAPAQPIVGPLTFEAFRRNHGDASLSEAEAAELAALSATDYPCRATYGAYLEHVAARILASLPEHVSVRHVRRSVTRIERGGEGFTLTTAPASLPDGRSTASPASTPAAAKHEAEAVILAIGHVDARLNPGQARLREKAGEAYFPPSIPSDVDWSAIPEGARVVIRGMGLNFFDVVTELTQGRGGQMLPRSGGRHPGALEYRPSGREPRIVALSRRGLPYAAKPDFSTPDRLPQPVFATRARLAQLLATGPVNFMESVWPLINADAQLEYWTARAENDDDGAAPLLADLSGIRAEAVSAGTCADIARLTEFIEARPVEQRLDLERLAKKLVGREFSDGDDHSRAVLEAVEADHAEAVRADSSPAKRAVAVVNEVRWLLKEFIPQGLLTDDSRHKDLRGWFEPLVESLASGPPSRRIAELAALLRAGVVQIVGPSPIVSAGPGLDVAATSLPSGTSTGLPSGAEDPSGDPPARFRVASPWVPGVELLGDFFLEAMMPSNAVASLDSPPVTSLVEAGLAQPHRLFIDGAGYAGTGFEVEGPARRLVGSEGPVDGLYCLGLQLSSLEWGTAIAASTDSRWLGGSLTIADADAIARDILA